MFFVKVLMLSVLIFHLEGHKVGKREERELLSSDQVATSLNEWEKKNSNKLSGLEGKILELSSAFNAHTKDSNAKVARLEGEIHKLSKLNDKLKQDMVRGQLPPVGFIYIQYGGQHPPNSLWPGANWTDVSSQYAGAFFRAVGGHSEPFGQNQRESMRTLLFEFGDSSNDWDRDLRTQSYLNYDDYSSVTSGGRGGSWNRLRVYYHQSGSAYGSRSKDNEVRPFNQAVRIWKRTS